MNALLVGYSVVKLLPLIASPAAAQNSFARGRQTCEIVAPWCEDQWECAIKSLQARAVTVTPVLEEILETRPPSHWGINE
jgi:hypothetical protein